MADDSLSLLVRDREKKIFEGVIESLTGVNEEGKFDILTKDSNFITLLNQTLVVRPKGGGAFEEIEVSNGVMRVQENKVEVFVGIKA